MLLRGRQTTLDSGAKHIDTRCRAIKFLPPMFVYKRELYLQCNSVRILFTPSIELIDKYLFISWFFDKLDKNY